MHSVAPIMVPGHRSARNGSQCVLIEKGEWRAASPGARGAALVPARAPNPANHRPKTHRDLINPLGSGLWVPRAPYRVAGPGFVPDCRANRGRFVENSFCGQQTRSGSQLQPVTVHLNNKDTRGAVANEFVFVFCCFPGGESPSRKLRVVFVCLLWAQALLETNENNEKQAGALPLPQRTSPGQVVPCFDVPKTAAKPGRALQTQAKQKLSAKRPETEVKRCACSFSLGKPLFGTGTVFLTRRVQWRE